MSSLVKPFTGSLNVTVTSKLPPTVSGASDDSVTDGPVGASGSITQTGYSKGVGISPPTSTPLTVTA